MAQTIASDASTALMTLWALASFTFLFVVLRLYTRIRVLRMYGTDDHFYNAAFMLFLNYNVLLQLAAKYGFGRDIVDIDSPDDLSRAILYEAIGQTLLITGNVFAKLSIGCFLDRLVTSRTHKVAIWKPALAFSLIVMISIIVFWFSCQPTAYLWDRRIDGRCDIDPGPAAVLAGASSVFVDLWYSGFPWYLLYTINMPLKEKLVVGSSMSLGIVAAACGAKRAVELIKIGSPNYPKDTVNLVVWHAAELSATMIGIGIPICLPLYKSAISRAFPKTSCSCCSNEPHRCKENEVEVGVFGMTTIGGTPYAFRGQVAPAD
ncbi:hypothetical protein F5B22DRAFT_660609 [Xylaria bambusicola]|uniref:uncharacterized protein n=1 Tax=Xylaria bambusicola TaxID=326684 RepID=UPI002007AE4B|nr:uncharacterized protein F5B22DRAFT_660609 [Xylaria bambusicola]KAI0522291.1 hypothetical protein F5B22DRAFT_660609 [Xylaria bambusicola]